jgi:hypothetical protein
VKIFADFVPTNKCQSANNHSQFTLKLAWSDVQQAENENKNTRTNSTNPIEKVTKMEKYDQPRRRVANGT